MTIARNISGMLRLAAMLAACCFSVQAQGPSVSSTDTPKNPVAAEPAAAQLKLPVWLEEQEGKYWEGARRQSFHVFLEDQEVPVKGFLNAQSGTVLLLVFDNVADIAKLEEIRNALGEQLTGLGDKYLTGLLSAQDGVSVLQEPTSDESLLKLKIKDVQIATKGGLLDTLEPVARMGTAIMQKASVRVAILYVTDSGVANYRADYLNPVINSSDSGDLSRRFGDRAIQERMSRLSEGLKRFTVPVFILHLLQRSDSLNLAYQSGLERVAADSGGEALFCRTNDEIVPNLEKLMTRIRTGYVLAVDAPKTRKSMVKVRVTAETDDSASIERVITVPQIGVRKR